MWMGDWNETEKDRAVAMLRKYGASVTTDTDPRATTRFSSDKKIDYYVTTDVNSTGPMRRKADKISDHMIIKTPLTHREEISRLHSDPGTCPELAQSWYDADERMDG